MILRIFVCGKKLPKKGDCPHGLVFSQCEPCYQASPGSEARFDTWWEENEHYRRLYEDHGGCKVA